MAKRIPPYTQMTLKHLRKLGCTVDVVERVVPYSFIRKDLFGIIDIIAIRSGVILGVQSTSGSCHTKRIQKALAEPRLLEWLRAGGKFEVWSWKKKGKRSKRKLWKLRVQRIRINKQTNEMEAEDG